jgi:hypothetical protein
MRSQQHRKLKGEHMQGREYKTPGEVGQWGNSRGLYGVRTVHKRERLKWGHSFSEGGSCKPGWGGLNVVLRVEGSH